MVALSSMCDHSLSQVQALVSVVGGSTGSVFVVGNSYSRAIVTPVVGNKVARILGVFG